MHFYAIVALPPGVTDVERAVDDLMAPFSENVSENGWWDWHQIGGRWSGRLDGYKPHLDPANLETCLICGGSGTRADGVERFGQEWADACGGCNGCNGLGMRVSWPTQWALHEGDVARFGDVKAKLIEHPPHTILFGEHIAHRKHWDNDAPNAQYPDSPGNFVQHPEQITNLLQQMPDGVLVVVVDYHS